MLRHVTLVEWLNQQRATHYVISRLGMRRVLNRALGAFPVVRTLPRTGVRYRCPYVDSFTLADELFAKHVYDAGIPERLETFCDLGSNVGQFVALLCERAGRRDLRGLAVDANYEMVEQTEWVLRHNELYGVRALCGLVGEPGQAGQAEDFFLHPVGVKSSAYAVDEPGHDDKGDWTRVRVLRIDLEAVWKGIFGDARCNLLKIDIEGSEADFMREDNPFLARVDAVIMEVHRWVIDPALMDERMKRLGFTKMGVLDDEKTHCVSHYRRS